MRAIVWLGPGSVELQARDTPTAGPGEVLVEVLYNGLCATDYPIVRGDVAGSPRGMILGHEPVGMVVKLGEGVRGLAAGQRVVLDTMLGCGVCRFCRSGHSELCVRSSEIGFTADGTWSDYAALPAANLHVLPSAVDSVHGALLEALTCQLGAVEALDIRPGETALIIGSGIAALTYIQLLRMNGAGTIAISMFDYPDRAALAEQFGAEHVIRDGNIQALLSRDPMRADHGFDVTIDAVGTPETIHAALALARRGGRVLLYGLSSVTVDTFPVSDVIFRNLTLFGRTSAPWMWQPAIDLVASKSIRLGEMVSEIVPLEAVPALLTAPENGPRPLKRVIQIRGEQSER